LIYSVEGPSFNLTSPDGSILATSDSEGTIYLWQAEDGQLLAALRGHRGEINQLAFSSDGKYLASASQDGTVRLWGVR
jgi:WD40 repeat protein